MNKYEEELEIIRKEADHAVYRAAELAVYTIHPITASVAENVSYGTWSVFYQIRECLAATWNAGRANDELEEQIKLTLRRL